MYNENGKCTADNVVIWSKGKIYIYHYSVYGWNLLFAYFIKNLYVNLSVTCFISI